MAGLDVRTVMQTMKRVKLNLHQLRKRCHQSIDRIMLELDGVIEGDDQRGYYAYKDNGSNILAVAHLDTVQKSKHFAIGDNIVFASKLDDRLGVYTILDFLPLCDVNVDILLTENEETLLSTGYYFETEKEYNWIVEFDRCGSDVVCYEYDWEYLLMKYFTVGIGSFSDISELEHLECKAVNVGIGYHDEHSFGAYFVVSEYLAQINKFLKFYKEHRQTRFPHTKKDYMEDKYNLTEYYGVEHGESWEEYAARQEKLGASYGSPKRTGLMDSPIMQCESCQDWFYQIEAVKNARGLNCPWCGQYVQ